MFPPGPHPLLPGRAPFSVTEREKKRSQEIQVIHSLPAISAYVLSLDILKWQSMDIS